MDPVLDTHGPWIFLVAIPVFVIFSFRAFFAFRGRAPRKPGPARAVAPDKGSRPPDRPGGAPTST